MSKPSYLKKDFANDNKIETNDDIFNKYENEKQKEVKSMTKMIQQDIKTKLEDELKIYIQRQIDRNLKEKERDYSSESTLNNYGIMLHKIKEHSYSEQELKRHLEDFKAFDTMKFEKFIYLGEI